MLFLMAGWGNRPSNQHYLSETPQNTAARYHELRHAVLRPLEEPEMNPVTPDGRYFVVRGQLWRCTSPIKMCGSSWLST